MVLPQGLSAFDIADALEEAGVIDDPLLFVAGLWIEDKQHALKAGEYVFEALVTPRGVMERLVAGKTVVHRLTVTEGMTSAEVVAALNAAPDLEGRDLEGAGGRLAPARDLPLCAGRQPCRAHRAHAARHGAPGRRAMVGP